MLITVANCSMPVLRLSRRGSPRYGLRNPVRRRPSERQLKIIGILAVLSMHDCARMRSSASRGPCLDLGQEVIQERSHGSRRREWPWRRKGLHCRLRAQRRRIPLVILFGPQCGAQMASLATAGS